MQATVRQRYEGQLKSIEPLSDLVRKLLSQEGFLDLFLEVRMLYPTYEDAYEMLEEQHERITENITLSMIPILITLLLSAAKMRLFLFVWQA